VDASDYPEEDDCNDNAKPTPEKAEGAGLIYPCTALVVSSRIVPLFFVLQGGRIAIANPGGHQRSRDSSLHGQQHEGMTMVLGLPFAVMLSRMSGATVYSVDIDLVLQFQPKGGVRHVGASSATAIKRCGGMPMVIVSGVPSASFSIPTEWIPENAMVINVAAGRSNFDKGTLLGKDAPCPGMNYMPHVGRVTVAMLEYILMSLHKKYNLTLGVGGGDY
jgi:hypothetical protein